MTLALGLDYDDRLNLLERPPRQVQGSSGFGFFQCVPFWIKPTGPWSGRQSANPGKLNLADIPAYRKGSSLEAPEKGLVRHLARGPGATSKGGLNPAEKA